MCKKKKKARLQCCNAICDVLTIEAKNWPHTSKKGEPILNHTVTYNHTHLLDMLVKVYQYLKESVV